MFSKGPQIEYFTKSGCWCVWPAGVPIFVEASKVDDHSTRTTRVE